MSGMQSHIKIFAGNANRPLAEKIAARVGLRLSEALVTRYPDGEISVKYEETVRGRDVFIVQPTGILPNEYMMELLIMLDAIKRASAARVTAVVPYYGYGRTDKKDQPRVPITARLVADLLTVAGANRLLTVDLHAGQIQGFFQIPVDELTALHLFVRYFKEKKLENLVVVATDIGVSKRARDLAERLNTPLAIIEKRRIGNSGKAVTLNVIGEVKGMRALTVDDEIDTGGSLVGAVNAVLGEGAREVYSCCTHPIFSGQAIEKLQACPVKEVVVTDTVPLAVSKKIKKVTVLSMAPLLGEAIHRIHTGLSMGAMFE